MLPWDSLRQAVVHSHTATWRTRQLSGEELARKYLTAMPKHSMSRLMSKQPSLRELSRLAVLCDVYCRPCPPSQAKPSQAKPSQAKPSQVKPEPQPAEHSHPRPATADPLPTDLHPSPPRPKTQSRRAHDRTARTYASQRPCSQPSGRGVRYMYSPASRAAPIVVETGTQANMPTTVQMGLAGVTAQGPLGIFGGGPAKVYSRR